MQRKITLQHEFVEHIPRDLEDKTLYVSMVFGTVVHKCCCGCGNKVITPLSPTDWQLTFDGDSISLDPSIGNWGFDCQSHYWIRHNSVQWAAQWSQREIEAERAQDILVKEEYFNAKEPNIEYPALCDSASNAAEIAPDQPKESMWKKLKQWISIKFS